MSKPTKPSGKNVITTTPKEPTRITRKGTKNQQLDEGQSNSSHPSADGLHSTGTPRTTNRSNSISSADSFEILEKRLFNSLSRFISQEFSELKEMLLHKIDQAVSSLNHDIATFREELEKIKCELPAVQCDVESLHRSIISSDAVLTGIPITIDEKPQQLLENISSLINHSLSPYATAFRPKSANSKPNERRKGKSPPLIVKFSSSSEQNIFLQKFRRHRNVSLKQIDPLFVSDSKVNAFESLTHHSQKLLRMALTLVRNKRIHSAFTRRGMVHIRLKPGDSSSAVFDEATITELVSGANT